MGVLLMLFFRRSAALWPVVLGHYLIDIANGLVPAKSTRYPHKYIVAYSLISSSSWEYRRRWVSDHSSSGFLRISSKKIRSSSDRRPSPSSCALDLSNNGRLTGSPAVMILVGRSGHSLASLKPSRPISTESLMSGSSKFSNFASILTKVNDNSHAGASLKIPKTCLTRPRQA
jgi:hypothetical protein